MASDNTSGQIPVASPVQGSLASIDLEQRGKALPTGGEFAPAAKTTGRAAAAAATAPANGAARANSLAVKVAVKPTEDANVLVLQLNKFLNTSGRPDQFRFDPKSDGKLIQQINPTNGAVIAEFAAHEFPALARSVGVAGLLVDSLA